VTVLRFDGEIGGTGWSSGTRIVIGRWPVSPFGPIADLMVETAAGHRILVAPTSEIADWIAATYRFDEVRIEPVTVTRVPGWLAVRAGSVQVRLRIGGRPLLGRLLALVPRPLARARWWCRVVDLPARVVLHGVRTVGTAGGGRREYYAALDLHRITGGSARVDGEPLGAPGPVRPPVRFGFGSTPPGPALVRITTSVQI
jgi:hypothetical protein